MTGTIKISVPLTPPSVGHYNRARCITMHGKSMPTFYHTPEAKAWWKAVAIAAGGHSCDGSLYNVAYVLYLPPRARMDLDNGSKVIMDGLTKAGVIRDDRYINELHAYKVKVGSDAEARTDIFIRPAGQLGLFAEEPPMPSLEDW